MNKRMTCPVCIGKKIIQGKCECNMEWRGNSDAEFDDCRCTEDELCSLCHGKGTVKKQN